jgi:apolipoprotein N-acyltransferase
MFISIAPVFAVVQFVREQRRVAVVLSLVAWGVGVFLVWFLWRHYLRKNADADKDVTTVAAPAPAVHTGAAAAH